MLNKYPLWKNLLLVFVLLIGCFYALPNLYSEDPVLQISTTSSNLTKDDLVNKVSDILKSQKIDYKNISLNNDSVEIRFKSTDMQLFARDKLKHDLGNGYTIALNLLPSTPKWLTSLNAIPMKQGLDLRGGVHFLLEVDVESVLNRKYEGIMKSVGQLMRDEGIRYSGIRNLPNSIDIRFRDDPSLNAAIKVIKSNFPQLVVSHNDEQIGLELSFDENEINNTRQSTIEQTMGILRNRVNELGVGEAVVQQQGATRVAVDLPGVLDAVHAKEILGGTATLQFFMVDGQNDPMRAIRTGVIPAGSKLYKMEDMPILLKRQVVLSGDSITSAVSSFDNQTASPSVSIQLGGGGEALFTKVTRENIGQRMAIVFVESKTTKEEVDGEMKLITKRDEKVISAPVIQSALGNNFQITGLTDTKEASNLALLLRAGALPAAIYPVEERTVGPSLGKENIQRGILSLEVGMGLILILMLVYYRLFGLVANIAIFFNLILLCALLSIIGATLTLPGIAGIVLTIGMAVDANVLINERIREELRNGVSPQLAINAGYERAFATILDANLTTLIVAIVLFSIGSGPIKGFAVTLSLGLLTSMLTGVTYSRAMINLIYGNKKISKLSIGV